MCEYEEDRLFPEGLWRYMKRIYCIFRKDLNSFLHFIFDLKPEE